MNPTRLEDFYGQPNVVSLLKVAFQASRHDCTPLPHMLLTGPPGVGKTLLSHIVAREASAELHEQIGQVLCSSNIMNGLLLQANEHDVVFIDEAHEMPVSIQTLLYRAMEDRCIFITTDKDKSIRLPVHSFTLILATTDEYALLQPLRDRCKLVLPFSFYDLEALAYIVKTRSVVTGCDVTDEIAFEIGQRSRNTPRIAIRLLESCQRVARSQGCDRVTDEHFRESMVLENIDSAGLGRDERHYLDFLNRNPGRPVRVLTLESVLGIHRRTIQHVIEPFLLRTGFIERCPAGRLITELGIEHLNSMNPSTNRNL